MKISSLYPYQSIDRVTHEDGSRYYVCPETGDHLTSVTTIISATSDKTFLKEWQERVGEKKANKERDEASALGTLLHTHMENHIQEIERPKGNNIIYKLAERMSNVLIRESMSKVDEVWGFEIALYFPGLYAGTTDLVGVFQGVPTIMDYKTSKKIKTEAQVEGYYLQGVAYALAHNLLFDTNISQVALFMVSRELEHKNFVINGKEFEHYADLWQQKLLDFEKLS